MATPATNIPPPDVRARLWAATARYVYTDDPALASLSPQLLKTIDSSSVKAFGHRLENAVKMEQKAVPKQGHLLKFQELFKTASTSPESPDQLATSIANTLLANKPERRAQASFTQLRTTLHNLANPTAPVAASPPAAPDTAAVPQPALATPASAVTITPISSTPMISWVALALSIISLLVSFFKGNSSRGRHRHSSASAPTLTSLTDEMRAEVRTMVQREVSNKMPGARPTPDAPVARPAAVASAAPKAVAPVAAPKTAAPPKPAPTPAKAPVPAPAPATTPAATSPAPVEITPQPAATTEAEDFFTVNYPVDTEPVAAPTRTLYANQQPIDGFFKRDMLAEAPASYTIFELTAAANTPDQAQFVVTSNPGGHAGYIGSHQNILSGACEYPFPKGSVSRIVSDAPGQAQRTASGDWQITRKAQIHFE